VQHPEVYALLPGEPGPAPSPQRPSGQAEKIVAEAGSTLVVADQHKEPGPIEVTLGSTLAAGQRAAADALAAHDLGMPVAPPGSDKTVAGCALIARHGVPTLVIVDRKPLVEQWRARLTTQLDRTETHANVCNARMTGKDQVESGETFSLQHTGGKKR
jgi:superfamily II DNA or RNA helicase